MSLLDKFKDQFVDRDDEDMEEEDLGEETAPVNPAQPVPPRPAAVRGIGRSAVPRQAAKPYTMVVVFPSLCLFCHSILLAWMSWGVWVFHLQGSFG